jgi:hypothetical protein
VGGMEVEIDIPLATPVHLDHVLIPVLPGHGRPVAITAVTSGGAVIPARTSKSSVGRALEEFHVG